MNDRRIFYLTALFSGVLFLASLYLIFSLPSKRELVSQASARENMLEQKHQKLSELLSVKRNLLGNQELLQKALPKEDAVPLLMTQIEGLGKLSGVRVSHLGFSLPQETQESVEVPGSGVSLTVVVTGSYQGLQTFLTNLESTSRLIAVTNLRFSQALEKAESGDLSSTLGVSAHFLPAEADVSLERPITLDISSESFVKLMARVKSLNVYQPVEEERLLE